MRSLWGAAIGGASVSLGIETVQFLLDVTVSTGRVADIDDVIGKAMGALAGAALPAGHARPNRPEDSVRPRLPDPSTPEHKRLKAPAADP